MCCVFLGGSSPQSLCVCNNITEMVAFSGDTYSTVSSPIPELCLAYWYNLKHDVFMHPESVPDKRDRVLYLTGVDKWHM